MKIVLLTDAEYRALWTIVQEGWQDGDSKAFGGARPALQIKAIEAFDTPFTTIPELQKHLINKSHLAFIKKMQKKGKFDENHNHNS